MGRVVLVTGASGGLGPFIVQALLTRGETVVAVARDLHKLRKVAGGHEVTADVSTESGAEHAVQQAEQFGPLEALVCAAGGFQGGSAQSTSLDVWNAMMTQNALSAFLVARAALKVMIPRGSGRIVFVGSVAAIEGSSGAAAYAASKAAVVSLAKSIAAAGQGHGITANAVLPSTIDTPGNRQAMPQANPAAWVRPEEVASGIVYLASEEASGVSGSLLVLPGH
jgi:NAD(P)-dependent dehydrogenase (short-subunit alcohol dehydrogenase family)